MAQFSKLKTGEKLSEVQYYSVVKVVGNKVQLVNDFSENIVVDNEYVEKCLTSASQFEREEKLNKTELATLFISNPGVALEVNFNKKVDEKDVVAEIMQAYNNSTPKDFETALKKSAKKALTGEPRTMIGRHFGELNEFGRVNFIDMNEVNDPAKPHDTRQRQVDPRTLNYLILRGIKYSVK